MKRGHRCALLALLFLARCASGPPQHIFVIGSATDPAGRSPAGPGGAPVGLLPVLLPDYLDTTDILHRSGLHEVVASATGRWAERLSAGVTHALLQDLTVHLPDRTPTLDRPSAMPSDIVSVSVEAFDIRTDGVCVLAANWTVAHGSGHGAAASGRATLSVPFTAVPGRAADEAIVAAMASAIDSLAGRIAETVNGGLPGA